MRSTVLRFLSPTIGVLLLSLGTRAQVPDPSIPWIFRGGPEAIGPPHTAGVAFTLPGGLVLELGAGGYGEILPFALSLGVQLLLRAGPTE